MDTLIDNRDFPQEMHEQPNNKSKKRSWIFIVIILFVLLLAAAAYFFFKGLPKKTSPEVFEDKPLSQTEVRENIVELQKIAPQETQSQKEADLQIFFN